jgi:hypothetical protein
MNFSLGLIDFPYAGLGPNDTFPELEKHENHTCENYQIDIFHQTHGFRTGGKNVNLGKFFGRESEF